MLKSRYPNISKKISNNLGTIFSKIPISPTTWTILSLLFAFVGFLALYKKFLFYGFLFFLAAGFIDAVDGAVARKKNKETNLGAYIDGIADRLVESMLILGLMFYGIPEFYIPGYIWLAILLFFGSCMTTFAKVYADHRKALTEKELKNMGGILERTERVSLILAGMLLGYLYDEKYITYSIALAAALAAATFMQRVHYTIKHEKKE
ncbi:MAG: CDP-alcohol phosphatidyltransferase family protein [Candidatus Aenigmarchaeota archaeon]|nr:CDP-alcohol phosphatidyltransferase family protein [Candidatus Aenigmarchaeota archaeon]